MLPEAWHHENRSAGRGEDLRKDEETKKREKRRKLKKEGQM